MGTYILHAYTYSQVLQYTYIVPTVYYFYCQYAKIMFSDILFRVHQVYMYVIYCINFDIYCFKNVGVDSIL